MPASQTTSIDGSLSPGQVWTGVAEASSHWAAHVALPLRDVVVIVPFAQLLEPARRAEVERYLRVFGNTGRVRTAVHV